MFNFLSCSFNLIFSKAERLNCSSKDEHLSFICVMFVVSCLSLSKRSSSSFSCILLEFSSSFSGSRYLLFKESNSFISFSFSRRTMDSSSNFSLTILSQEFSSIRTLSPSAKSSPFAFNCSFILFTSSAWNFESANSLARFLFSSLILPRMSSSSDFILAFSRTARDHSSPRRWLITALREETSSTLFDWAAKAAFSSDQDWSSYNEDKIA